jgi:hypothetical protein
MNECKSFLHEALHFFFFSKQPGNSGYCVSQTSDCKLALLRSIGSLKTEKNTLRAVEQTAAREWEKYYELLKNSDEIQVSLK